MGLASGIADYVEWSISSHQSPDTSHRSLISHNIRDGVDVVDRHEMSAGSVDLA